MSKGNKILSVSSDQHNGTLSFDHWKLFVDRYEPLGPTHLGLNFSNFQPSNTSRQSSRLIQLCMIWCISYSFEMIFEPIHRLIFSYLLLHINRSLGIHLIRIGSIRLSKHPLYTSYSNIQKR